MTEAPVKAVLVGPWTSGYRALHARPGERAVVSRAERLRETVEALAAASCPLVEIEEAEADRIGEDSQARQAFREAHIRIAREIHGTHLSLSIVGGSAWEAGAATILDAPYASLAVDLIAGPENWRLVANAPHERGIVVGVIDPAHGSEDGPELPVWAAQYAASTKGRGLARVGIGTAGSLARLPWAVALAKLRALGEAARVAALPPGELADNLDPRAVSIRSAAMGRPARRGARP
jgi:methionine synthase II (cobalamin-independent)